MPKFTLIKQPDNDFDCEVTVTFDTDMLGVAREHFDDFLKASGFEIPLEELSTPVSKSKIDYDLERAEDAMWDEAIDFKFRDDGPVGSAGSDVIKLPSRY